MDLKLDIKKVQIKMAEHCLNRKDLSEKSGINYRTLTQYLNGSRKAKTKMIGKIAVALNTDVTEIIESN